MSTALDWVDCPTLSGGRWVKVPRQLFNIAPDIQTCGTILAVCAATEGVDSILIMDGDLAALAGFAPEEVRQRLAWLVDRGQVKAEEFGGSPPMRRLTPTWHVPADLDEAGGVP